MQRMPWLILGLVLQCLVSPSSSMRTKVASKTRAESEPQADDSRLVTNSTTEDKRCPGVAVFRCEGKRCMCDECDDLGKYFDLINKQKVAVPHPNPRKQVKNEMVMYADLHPKYKGPNGKVLFLYPSDDHNGAFAFRRLLCDRIKCWKHQGKQVHMRVVSTVQDASNILDSFDDGSLTDVVLGGHGAEDSLGWGTSDNPGSNIMDNFYVSTQLSHYLTNSFSDGMGVYRAQTSLFLRKLRRKVQVGGSVLLDSCLNAGKVGWGNNFFQYVASMVPGRKVTACQECLEDEMWKRDTALDESCIAGNAVRFREKLDSGKSVNVTSIIEGAPSCWEMTAEQVRSGDYDYCHSICAMDHDQRSCEYDQQYWHEADALAAEGVRLVWEPELKDETPVSQCTGSMLGRTVAVCRIDQR